MKALLTLVLLVSSTIAQDKSPVAQALAACGPAKIRFDVTIDEYHHPQGQPDAGKALVYVVEDGGFACGFLCSTINRFAVDGAWVGANDGNSYFYFYADPGEHRACTDRETKSEDNRIAALAPFTAEAGKTYYFRARVFFDQERKWKLYLDLVNEDEGKLLVAYSAFSAFHVRK